MGKGSKEVNRFFFNFLFLNFSMVMKWLNLLDYQAKTQNYRKGLTYLENRARTSQNQTLHSQKNKTKQNKTKKTQAENNWRSPKKRKGEEWGIIKSTGKRSSKWQ